MKKTRQQQRQVISNNSSRSGSSSLSTFSLIRDYVAPLFLLCWSLLLIYTHHYISLQENTSAADNNNNFQGENRIPNLRKVERRRNENTAVDNQEIKKIENDNSNIEKVEKRTNKNIAGSNNEVIRKLGKNNRDEWDGWAPELPEEGIDSSCASWRECFKADHKCQTKCRDNIHDMGIVPTDISTDWIPDVTIVRRMFLNGHDAQGNVFPPPLDDELCEKIGVFGGQNDDNKVLLDKVPIIAKPMNGNGPKILCSIYTMESVHHSNIRAIRETWGGGCDGFLAFSTANDPRIPAINIKHDGPEEYNNMWQKIRSIWKFNAQHYLDDFDFFFIGGDDLFVLPQNLRDYLGSLPGNPNEIDYFAGRRFKGYGIDNYFNSGGAGYALSRSTLRKFYENIDQKDCSPTAHTSMEDVMIAKCLRKVLDIPFYDTRDDKGRERFHPFSPGSHYSWRPPAKGGNDWYEDYNTEWGIKLREECCAPDSVSFHYMKKPSMVRHIHQLLYNCK